jgi:(p)ppGpp synthase/HD superfamily hydrolase
MVEDQPIPNRALTPERVPRPRRRERVMKLEQAIAFAARKHRGQVDKVGAAYILHPLRVMLRMHSVPGRRVAVLHDVIEDCGVSRGELLEAGLPEADVEAVEALTRRPDETYRDYVARAGENGLARKVKLADLADNMDPDRLALVERARREALLEKYRAAKDLLERLPDSPR